MQYQKANYQGPARMGGRWPMAGAGRPCAAEKGANLTPLAGISLAMVYAPCQDFDKLYEPGEGLGHGTIFAELDMPFFGAGRMA